MKNIIRTLVRLSAFSALAVVLFSPMIVFSAEPPGASPVALQNPLDVGSFSELIDSILKIVIQIGTPIAVLAIIYSGFLFVTAQGNEEKLNTAKSALTWSVVGTAVLLGSWILAGAIGSTIEALSG